MCCDTRIQRAEENSTATESRSRNRGCRRMAARRGYKEDVHQNMSFYQTNPPFFDGFFDGSAYEYIGCTRNVREKSVGSF